MRLSNMLFLAGGIILAGGSFVWGITNGVTMGQSLGQVTGTMVPYALTWFIYSRAEFQVNRYLQRRQQRRNPVQEKGEDNE